MDAHGLPVLPDCTSASRAQLRHLSCFITALHGSVTHFQDMERLGEAGKELQPGRVGAGGLCGVVGACHHVQCCARSSDGPVRQAGSFILLCCLIAHFFKGRK